VWHIYFRYKDILGKHHTIHRQSKEWKLKKEAVKVEQQLKLELTRNYDDLTYEQLFNLYIDERSGKIKNRSLFDLTKLSDRLIAPYFKKMSDITPNDIKKWQKYLMSLELSNGYIKKIQQQLRTVITFGLKYEYISYNPFKFEISKNSHEFKKEMNWWEQKDFNQFINVVDEEGYKALFSLLYWTGLRIGEALALQVHDVDFKVGTIAINKTYDDRFHEVTTPKTSNSYRVVHITENVVIMLSNIIEKHKTIFDYSPTAFIFGYDIPFAPSTIRRHFNNYIEVSGVNRIRIHDLRHSHVSLLRSLGFDRYEVSKRLGHTPEMVENTYSHWFESSQQKMVDKLNYIEKSSESATILQPRINKH